jgi:signal peptidase I
VLSKRLGATLELVLLLAVAVCLTLVVRANAAQAFSIPSESMVPQLEVGDRVVVSKTSYRLHDVRRGDIIVFPHPQAQPDTAALPTRVARDLLETVGLRKPPEDELIKRVVGLPGEVVGAEDGHVVVDGRVLVEPYLRPGTVTGDFGPTVVPHGHVFVLGDNRANSSDSRVIGTIEVDTIVGRAIARVWPPTRTAFL